MGILIRVLLYHILEPPTENVLFWGRVFLKCPGWLWTTMNPRLALNLGSQPGLQVCTTTLGYCVIVVFESFLSSLPICSSSGFIPSCACRAVFIFLFAMKDSSSVFCRVDWVVTKSFSMHLPWKSLFYLVLKANFAAYGHLCWQFSLHALLAFAVVAEGPVWPSTSLTQLSDSFFVLHSAQGSSFLIHSKCRRGRMSTLFLRFGKHSSVISLRKFSFLLVVQVSYKVMGFMVTSRTHVVMLPNNPLPSSHPMSFLWR